MEKLYGEIALIVHDFNFSMWSEFDHLVLKCTDQPRLFLSF